jgi:hypothetical protein
MSKPKIRFSASKVYTQTHLKAACPVSDSLFLLLKRSTIHSNELMYVGQMGFEIELIGDIKPVVNDIGKSKVRVTAKGVFFDDDD